MLLEVLGPPAVSVSVVPFACVTVTLVMLTFPAVGLNPLTKSLACGESAMSSAVICIVAGLFPWVCEIDADALVAIRIVRLGLGEIGTEEIWIGIFDVGEVGTFARIEHLAVNADGRRTTALRRLDHAVGGTDKRAVRRVDNRMLGDHNQRIIDVPYGTEQVRSRVQRVEIEGQRCAGGDADRVE